MQCLAETGGEMQVKKLLSKAISEGTKEKSREEIFNIQFIGEGYKMAESKRLRKFARTWESDIVGERSEDNIR